MKRIWIGLLYMLLLVVFPAQIARANPHLPEQVFIVGLADGDGHGHESEDDAHTDDEDDHGDDEDHHAGDEDNHHANDGNGHSHDDGHHDEPFSITSLTPLFAGIGVGAVVSGVAHNRFRNALDGKHLAVIALTCITGTLHLLVGATWRHIAVIKWDWILRAAGVTVCANRAVAPSEKYHPYGAHRLHSSYYCRLHLFAHHRAIRCACHLNQSG